jgi:protein phosphatase
MRSLLVEADLGALSHPGKVRPNNEDHFLVVRFQRTMNVLLTNLPEGTVPENYADTAFGLLVADGMGGAAAGEVASRTAIRTLVDLALQTPDWIMRLDEQSTQQVLDRMDQRFGRLKDALIEQAQADPKLAGMGTTMTLALSVGADLLISHIGDSRAYLVREGALIRLTHDQTIAQSLADAGAIRPEDVARHPMRHMLTGAITAKKGKASSVQLQHLRMENGDGVLLCTDGLTDLVADDVIERAVRDAGPSAAVCRSLVDLALEAGGKDNVTVVFGKYRIEDR